MIEYVRKEVFNTKINKQNKRVETNCKISFIHRSKYCPSSKKLPNIRRKCNIKGSEYQRDSGTKMGYHYNNCTLEPPLAPWMVRLGKKRTYKR